MTPASALVGSDLLRFSAAGACAMAIAGALGAMIAGWTAPDAPRARALVGDAAVSATSQAASASTSIGITSRAQAAEAQAGMLQKGARTDHIWEVSIGADASSAAGTGVVPVALWRIGGVFESDSGSALIVVFGNAGLPQYLRVGDLLPNRAKIIAITRDDVIVKTRINNRWVLVSLNV